MDSDHIFMITENGGLLKMSKAEGDSNALPMLMDHNPDAGLSAGQSLLFLNNKLYVLKNDSEKPLAIFNADTLKEDTEAEEAIKWDEAEGAITMKLNEEGDKETGRR